LAVFASVPADAVVVEGDLEFKRLEESASIMQEKIKRDLRAKGRHILADDVRVLATVAALPQNLTFTVPMDFEPGASATVSGPHGPMDIPLPDTVVAGATCTVLLGPPSGVMQVAVPESAVAGDRLTFPDQDGVMREVFVPDGKKPGDVLEIVPQALMVRVPPSARPGDTVVCLRPDNGEKITAVTPGGLKVGDYFAVMFGSSIKLKTWSALEAADTWPDTQDFEV